MIVPTTDPHSNMPRPTMPIAWARSASDIACSLCVAAVQRVLQPLDVHDAVVPVDECDGGSDQQQQRKPESRPLTQLGKCRGGSGSQGGSKRKVIHEIPLFATVIMLLLGRKQVE